jgi:hypothetical protein
MTSRWKHISTKSNVALPSDIAAEAEYPEVLKG